MNRDALLATVIGFIIGIGITSALLFGPSLFRNIPGIRLPTITLPNFSKQKDASAPSQKSSASKGPITNLAVTSPAEQTIVGSKDLAVSGKAPADSTVVIGGPFDEAVVKPDADGTFSGTVTVEEGTNRVDVAAFHNGQSDTMHVTVYFTQEKL